MFGRLSKLFQKSSATAKARGAGAGTSRGKRSIPGGSTHRLNQAGYGGGEPKPISTDLLQDLSCVRNRSRWEARYNGVVMGAVEKHVADLIGPKGPTLQVSTPSINTSTKDKAYIDAFEFLYSNWCRYGDYYNRDAMPELMASALRAFWTDGDRFFLETYDAQADTPLKFRLQGIAPERVANPMGLGGFDSRIYMGIERDATGRVSNYHVSKDVYGTSFSMEYSTVPAPDMMHLFMPTEVSQLRGLPWLASSLGTLASIRQYDSLVMQAASMAAGLSVIMYDDNEFSDKDGVSGLDEDFEIEDGMVSFIDGPHKPFQLKAEQPVSNYCEFRQELLKGLGLPVGMPGMLILNDASGHNYSSARFDAQMYVRSNAFKQGYLERVFLNRVAERIAREGELAGLLPSRPKHLKFNYMWPVMPHVDPAKEAKAEALRLENKTLSLKQACNDNGIDYETHLEQLKHEKTILSAFEEKSTETKGEKAFMNGAKAMVEQALEECSLEIDERIELLEGLVATGGK